MMRRVEWGNFTDAETKAAVEEGLGYLRLLDQIRVIMAAVDETGRDELIAYLEDGEPPPDDLEG